MGEPMLVLCSANFNPPSYNDPFAASECGQTLCDGLVQTFRRDLNGMRCTFQILNGHTARTDWHLRTSGLFGGRREPDYRTDWSSTNSSSTDLQFVLRSKA